MLAIQPISNMKQALPEVRFSQATTRELAYKPKPIWHERNVVTRIIPKLLSEFSSVGFIIPFQPSMWDEKKIESAWNTAMQMVETKLKEKYSEECTSKISFRLKILFGKINLNTHRKSLAIFLTPDEEKIIYLSFPVKPVVFSGNFISLLDIFDSMQHDPDFYYLVLNKGYVCLYVYNNDQLSKVYQQNDDITSVNLFKNASNTIELLNGKYEKPVFVTGRPNLVEQFCNSEFYSDNYFTLLYHKTPFSIQIIQSLINEINKHWRYWRSKFIVSRVLLAQKSNGLISHVEAVLQALRRSADGFLLIDNRLKNQVHKSISGKIVFQLADDVECLIEKFLARGNRFEITETDILKDMGGIVLLKYASLDIQGGPVTNKRKEVFSVGDPF